MGYLQYPGDGGILYTDEEYQWARRRPPEHRPPIPQVGDEVWYRHIENGTPVRAEVLAVQDLDDFTDPNLWYFQTDEFGRPVELDGKRVLARAHDPWPELTLRTPYGVGIAREARLRGACGWLPLDWETRPRPPAPQFVIAPGS